jgi:Notch 1
MLRPFLLGCFVGVIAVALSGCKANPYCLNCGQSQGGFGGDAGTGGDLAGADLVHFGVDLAGGGGNDGLCVPTAEICNGIDDDCNGVADNVDPTRLQNDPNNCGACGTQCNYSATHQFGSCVNGSCMPSGCTPGFVDADQNAANGCELQCAPTTPPDEVCDGLDNDCNGTIDDGFTNTYAANGQPNYDKDVSNCGGCGFVCNLQGAVNKCGALPSGRGTCQVDACINNAGADTFKHDPAKGDLDVTGCEYHCPVASSTAGDCAAGGCTFPAETCNGSDDDCNFVVDDNLTDPDLNMPCGARCPGGLVGNCRGQCTAGTTICASGVKQCMGGSGPTAEVCDGVDNNCDGQVDELFTAPSPGGYAGGNPLLPLYNSDPNNCGGCSVANSFKCKLANATNGCHSATANAQGNCYVVSCNSGFNYAPKTDSDVNNPTCNVNSAARDSTAGNVNTGVGCQYTCPAGAIPSASEAICDAKDNNCDGCIDNGLTPPTGLCATQGGCNGQSIPILCRGMSGWKCNYAAIPLLDVDGSGNLATIETKCDARDNNCNGFCDENFPNVATPNNTTLCPLNPNRAAAACTAGQGLCQQGGTFCCGSVDGSCSPAGTTGANVVCSAVPNTAAAQNEACNGLDDNCNGLVDDPNPANGRSGYRDTTVRVSVPAGDPSVLGNAAAHTVFVYPWEASRPDAGPATPGGLSTRACATPSVIPWSNAARGRGRSLVHGVGVAELV